MSEQNRELFLLSLLLLYTELLLIRWISTEINIFAYLQNAILVCCFLGIGCGCLRPARDAGVLKSMTLLAVLVALLSAPGSELAATRISEALSVSHDFVVWDQGELLENHWLGWAAVLFAGVVSIIFICRIIFAIMFPFGQRLSAAFDEAPQALTAYTANILGSLAGVWLFSLLGYFGMRPSIWCIVVFFLFLPLVKDRCNKAQLAGLAFLMIGLPLVKENSGKYLDLIWSPYQKLDINPIPHGYFIGVNNTGFQAIIDNSLQHHLAFPADFPAEEENLTQYDIPMRLADSPRNVLVVGAGTGNDVAGVLRHGAASVTAVEIDPAVSELGTKYHPEHPYEDRRVHLVTNDARAYFAQSKEQFDLIIFGLLDSHTTPALTNARLDHFVYTQESIAAAKGLLSANGVMVLLFQANHPFIVRRIENTLTQVFGEHPLMAMVPKTAAGWGGSMFITGNLRIVERRLNDQPELKTWLDNHRLPLPGGPPAPVIAATDDWPYLYLDRPRIPLLFCLFSLVLGGMMVRTLREEAGSRSRSGSSAASILFYASMGAAFLLLESHNVTRAAVVFGNTWFVNSFVISGVLGMIILGNVIAMKTNLRPHWRLIFALLLLSCAGLYCIDFGTFNRLAFLPRALMVTAILSLPVFFSGMLFASFFSRSRSRSSDLAANLFGSLLGGVLQISTMVFGIRALMLLVTGLYAIAFFFAGRLNRALD